MGSQSVKSEGARAEYAARRNCQKRQNSTPHRQDVAARAGVIVKNAKTRRVARAITVQIGISSASSATITECIVRVSPLS